MFAPKAIWYKGKVLSEKLGFPGAKIHFIFSFFSLTASDVKKWAWPSFRCTTMRSFNVNNRFFMSSVRCIPKSEKRKKSSISVPENICRQKFFFAPNLLLVPRCQVFPAKTLLNANVRSFRQLVFAKLHKTRTKRTKSNGKGCWCHLNSSANYFIVHHAFSWNRRT